MGKLIRRLAVWSFPFWERLGLHILPDHFYYPVPSRHDLPPTIWSRRYECIGLDWNVPVQRQYLGEIFPLFTGEMTPEPKGGLSLADAAVLHAMVRHHRPQRMFEVGSGHSTEVAAAACVLNAREGQPCELTAIEPYPNERLQHGFPGLGSLIRSKVQDTALDTFLDCDLLFIDSSHVVGIGSDVNFLVLEVLPRLKPGCVIHFHDILLPGEYWKDWVLKQRYYWSEQYLLWAFLLFNTEFEVLWAGRYMQLHADSALKQIFPFYQSHHRLTSFWLRRRESGGITAANGAAHAR